jgi:hypothetical protein
VLISIFLAFLISHLFVATQVARASHVFTTLIVAAYTVKEAACWLERCLLFLLIYLFSDCLDCIVGGGEFSDDGLWETQFHRVMGERTVLTELLNCFDVRSWPSVVLDFVALIFERAHDCLEQDFLTFAWISSSHRALERTEAAHLLLDQSLRRFNLFDGFFCLELSVDKDHSEIKGFS